VAGVGRAADQALEGITTVLLSDAVPNAVVLNPRDWANALKAKASGDGHYFSAGPFLDTAERLWGAPAVPSPAVAQGTVLVGDFALAAALFVREVSSPRLRLRFRSSPEIA
jgi:hypothetical protein